MDIPDQYLHVPRRTSALRFVLMIALVVVLLIIFIIPGAIFNVFGREESKVDVFARWNRPGHEQVEISSFEFTNAQRRYALLFQPPPARQGQAVFLSPGQALGLQLGVLEPDRVGINADLSYEDVARLLVLETLAADAGIVITDKDVYEHLIEYVGMYGSKEAYRQSVTRLGGEMAFQEALRAALAVQRYLLILGEAATALPDPRGVEEAWERDHVETSYDFVEIEIASLAEEVRPAVPDDAGLQAWFDGLEDLEKNRYLEPERRRVEFVFYRDPETTPATGLLEKFPAPAEAVATDRTREYYAKVFFDRFPRPVGEEGAPEEPPREGAAASYFTQEEVAERCTIEAPIYFALERWLRDLERRRNEGETIDLAAEAAALDLAHEALPEPLDLAALTSREGLGGGKAASEAFASTAGDFGSSVVARPDSLLLLRASEVIAPAIPPLAAIHERVVDQWIAKESEARAVARLTAIRDGFPELVLAEGEEDENAAYRDPKAGPRRRAEAEAFRAAAEAAGYEVRHRDWLDRMGRPDADPDRELPAHRFLTGFIEPTRPAAGEVPPVEVDGAAEHAYLVRLAGTRQVPIDRMSPRDYERYRDQTQRPAATARFMQAVDVAYLRQQYGLWLFTDDLPVKQGAEDAGASPAEKPAQD
ncbi:MAG: hypothetical protein AB1726_11970 [Planctomycetota bacterium]